MFGSCLRWQLTGMICQNSFTKPQKEDNFMNKYFATFAIFALALSGCASSSKEIGKAHVSALAYKNYTCDELTEEANYINARVKELATSLDSEATKDVAQTTGAFVLAPFTFGLSLGILGALEGGDGPEAVEYAQLKGQHEAIRKAAIRKKCRIK
jgi:hypothetical protein